MYEILKALAAANDWVFDYGRTDFQNLFKAAEQKEVSHIFLDPVKIRDINNDYGVTEQKVYSGSFMILYSSDIDEKSYDDRYQQYIKPIVQGDLKIIKDSIACDNEPTFDQWETIEVINIFDYNFDGIICNYQITLDFEETIDTYAIEFIVANNEIPLEGAIVSILGQESKETDSNGKAVYYGLENGNYNYIIVYESEVVDEGVVTILDSDIIKKVGFWSILQNDTAGIAYANQGDAYGLVFDGIINKGNAANLTDIHFISSSTSLYTNAYRIIINTSGSLRLGKDASSIFSTATSYIAGSTDYRIIIWRNKTLNQYVIGVVGTFVMYIQGKNKAITTKKYLIPNTNEMELVIPSSGQNPILDNTYTTSNYIVTDFDAEDQVNKIEVNGKYISPYAFTVSTGVYSIIDEI